MDDGQREAPILCLSSFVFCPRNFTFPKSPLARGGGIVYNSRALPRTGEVARFPRFATCCDRHLMVGSRVPRDRRSGNRHSCRFTENKGNETI